MTRPIGIDLGTTNSVIAHCIDGEPEVLENIDGHRTTPSVVSLTDDGFIVGQQAQNQLLSQPDRTVASIKREMGTGDSISLGTESYTPVEISSAILSYLKQSAEQALQEPVTDAVVTVPAYFDHRQRIATKEAAQLAGLDVLRIMNEPTAACLPYGLRDRGNDTTVLVYDLGGGTFDISVVDISDGVFDVLGTDGDDQLGGDDWDGAIVHWLLEKLDQNYDVSVPEPIPLVLEERLFQAAEEAKHTLSTRDSVEIQIPFLEVGSETITLEETLSRESFEAMNRQRLQRTIEISTDLWNEFGTGNPDDIILVGGSTRMPMVQTALEDAFGIEPRSGVRADEAVARGAAIQAGILGREALPGNSESSAHLPSVPGSREDTIVLIDSAPKALGVEVYEEGTDEKFFSNIIPKHASIPAQNTRETYQTRHDNQRYVEISVLQSKTATLEDAEGLDTFEFGPLPERPAGHVQFAVTFTLTEDGTLRVEVADTEGFAEDEIEITSAVETADSELRKKKQHLPTVANL